VSAWTGASRVLCDCVTGVFCGVASGVTGFFTERRSHTHGDRREWHRMLLLRSGAGSSCLSRQRFNAGRWRFKLLVFETCCQSCHIHRKFNADVRLLSTLAPYMDYKSNSQFFFVRLSNKDGVILEIENEEKKNQFVG
jgi:hypothetical protein